MGKVSFLTNYMYRVSLKLHIPTKNKYILSLTINSPHNLLLIFIIKTIYQVTYTAKKKLPNYKL